MALTEIPKELSSTPGIVDNSNATAITIDASGNVLFGSTGQGYIDGNNANTYNSGYNQDDDSWATWINYNGYQGGTTRYRDFIVGDGKNGRIATFDGSTGNVGIGTTTPDNTFHVVAGAAGEVAQFTGAIENRGLSIRSETNTDASAHVVFNSQSGGSKGMFTFETDSTERIRITSTGYVGINTNSPGVELDIKRTANRYPLRIQSVGGEGRAIVFADVQITPTKYNWIAGAQFNTNNAFEITPSTAVGGYTFTNPAITILETGNVGIGTSTPNAVADLHVADTSDARIWLDATSADTMELYSGTGVGMFNRSNSYLMLGTNNVERMRIDASGNVRINSDSAAASGTKSLQFFRDSVERGRVKFDFSNSSLNLQADGVMTFMTTGENERMQIDASGHAIIPAGVTLGTAVGVYNAANTLDDYEEGTWIPTITNSTGSYNFQIGRYTKIGNLVYVTCSLKTPFTNTGATSQEIGGLPFVSENVANLFNVGTIFPVSGFNQANSDLAAQISINNTVVDLYTVAPATGINYTGVASNTFGTSVEFEFSACYRTA